MRLATTAAVLALAAAPVAAQGWIAGPTFPDPLAPRAYAAGLAYQGRVYAVGGLPLVAPKNEEAPVHELTLGAGAWVPRANLDGPVARVGVGEDAFGRIVVFGGADALDPEGDFGKTYAYDLVEGKKTSLADRSAAAGDDHFAWTTDALHRLYSIGGVEKGAFVATSRVERYDAIPDVWSTLAPLPTAVAGAAAVDDGQGHLLVIGGWTSSSTYSANVARYDLSTGAWSDTAIPDLPAPTAHLAAVRGADGRVYAIGGKTALGTTSAVWVLDAQQTAWTAGPPLPSPRAHLGAALGADNNVYAMGGLDGQGGTSTTVVLYTPSCPEFPNTQAATVEVWQGLPAVLGVEVFGGGTLTLQWLRNGAALQDGPALGGGTISGATTDTLRIDGATPADDGAYELVVTNGCGSATSPAQTLAVLTPPSLVGTWTVQSLHPAGALSSTAASVDEVSVVGSGSYPDATYTQLEHPLVWTLGASSVGPAVDLTPAGSVGGGLTKTAGGVHVGWYWWPYWTKYGTAYNRHAGVWDGSAGAFTDVQPSGWEYGSLSDTDGTHHVGGITPTDSATHSFGAYWKSTQKSALNLTPAGDWGGSVGALHGEHQYGSVIHPYAVVHAARWKGTAASYEDMNPVGSSWSYVSDAADGAAVGRATFGGVHHAVLWDGTPDAWVDLHPTGAASSTAVATHGGLQVGTVGNQGVLWAGVADQYVDLGALLGAQYSWGFPTDVRVLADGVVLVTGYGYDAALGRTEALLWRLDPATLAADVDTISLAAGGTQHLTLTPGPAFAGQLHLVLGSTSGTSPGLPVDGVTLPLNLDSYLLWSVGQPGPIFQGTFGFLDASGAASASLLVPAGTNPTLAGLQLHHAGLVLDLAAGGIAVHATNPVPLTLAP